MNINFLGKVCCGIVLYNPEIELLEKNIDALYPQVSEIVLINNNSSNVDAIYQLIKKYNSKIELINNKENYGIAKALNQIFSFAERRGYEWYLTMDQDSIVSSNLIEEYFVCAQDYSVGIISPYILNNNKVTLQDYEKMQFDKIEILKDPIDCITSGALNRVKSAKIINGYTNEMFIDSVDVDFNIRIMEVGEKIVRVNTTYLIQQMGKGRSIAFLKLLYKITHIKLFKQLSVSPVYSDFRLYYIFRNSKYLAERYGLKAGKRMTDKWMFGQAVYYCITYPLNRSRIKMIKAILKGRKDSKKLGEIIQ